MDMYSTRTPVNSSFQRISSSFVYGLIIFLPFLRRSTLSYPQHDWILLGIIAVATILLFSPKRYKASVSCVDITLLGLALWIGIGVILKGHNTVTLSSLSLGLIYLQVYFLSRRYYLAENGYKAVFISASVHALVIVAQYLGYAEGNRLIIPTGTFPNPAPLSCLLALGFSSGVYWITRRSHWSVYLFTGLILVVLLLTPSRAGCLAALAGAFYILAHRKISFSYRWTKYGKAILAVLLVGLLAGLYWIRTDSANGRILIWKVSARMFADRPLLGHGPGSFPQVYPFYQADYFTTHPESVFVPVADNVQTPYNEFLSVLVQSGLVGFLLFVFIIVLGWRLSENHGSKSILLVLLIFGCFSYPLLHSTFVIIFLMALAGLSENAKTCSVSLSVPYAGTALCLGYLLICIPILIAQRPCSYQNAPHRIGWEIHRLYHQKQYDSVAHLFTYAPSVELCIDLAQGYAISGDYHKARDYAMLANRMVPNRIMPTYLLFRIYQLQDLQDSSVFFARKTVNFTPKIENTTTLKAKREAFRFLDTLEQ